MCCGRTRGIATAGWSVDEEKDGGGEEDGPGQAEEQEFLSEGVFVLGEPMAEEEDEDDAPEAARTVDDVCGSGVAPVCDGGDDEESLKADEGGAESEIGSDGAGDGAERLLESGNEDKGVDGGEGAHDRREATDTPSGRPTLDEDIEAGVGRGGNEGTSGRERSAVHAGPITTDTEKGHGEGGHGGGSPDARGQRFAQQEPGEEGNHKDLEAEHGGSDGGHRRV